MGKVKSILFSGLKAIVPILFTILLIYWVFIGMERFFRWILLLFINPSYYFSGLGWISAFILTIILGLFIQIPFVKKGIDIFKAQFIKIPIIKTLYRMSSDVMQFLTKDGLNEGKVVKIKTPVGMILGIMTQEKLQQLPDGIGTEKEVAVYIPMSYQIGGFTFIVSKDSVEEVDISVEKAAALTMTAYISGKQKKSS